MRENDKKNSIYYFQTLYRALFTFRNCFPFNKSKQETNGGAKDVTFIQNAISFGVNAFVVITISKIAVLIRQGIVNKNGNDIVTCLFDLNGKKYF